MDDRDGSSFVRSSLKLRSVRVRRQNSGGPAHASASFRKRRACVEQATRYLLGYSVALAARAQGRWKLDGHAGTRQPIVAPRLPHHPQLPENNKRQLRRDVAGVSLPT